MLKYSSQGKTVLYVRFHHRNRGLIFAAFGAGLIISMCFPTKIMVVTLAVLLVCLGLNTH